jgi:hypothetical protein
MDNGDILNANHIVSVTLSGEFTLVTLVNSQEFQYRGDIRSKLLRNVNLALTSQE